MNVLFQYTWYRELVDEQKYNATSYDKWLFHLKTDQSTGLPIEDTA